MKPQLEGRVNAHPLRVCRPGGFLLHTPEIPDDAGLRIRPAGESQLTLEIASKPAPGDQVVEQGGAPVFVDSEAAPMLENAELDARMEGDQVAFGLTPTGGDQRSSGSR